jgi:D-threo-aldose 1-dehydrogenase
MDPAATRILGTSGLAVTQLGLGAASYGSLFHRVPERDALDVVDAAWGAGIRYFDTAPWYGRGLSETRTGAGLRDRPRDEYILSTKIGRWLKPQIRGSNTDLGPWTAPLAFDVVFDYSYDGIMRAYEQSQLRLGLPWYDVAVIHDLDGWYHGHGVRIGAFFDQLATGGYQAILELKAHGLLKAVGAGINHAGLIPRFLEIVDVDFFLLAMPYTLLRQDLLDDEMPACVERGIGFVIGAPYQSGILASGSRSGKMADYAPPTPEVLAKVEAIERVCARHGVPLAAAALQFVMGHPSVATVIPGARTATHVERTVAAFRHEIPADLWAELKHERLLREDAPVPA